MWKCLVVKSLHCSDYLPEISGTEGIRLEGIDVDRVRELLDDGRVWMKLRLKGVPPPLPRVQAELCWGLGEKPHFMTGWRFTDIDLKTIQLIESTLLSTKKTLLRKNIARYFL